MGRKKPDTNTGFSDIEEGFLFKPVSERGSLVILLPSSYRDSQVVLKGADGKVLEQGVSHGYANGDREHFRFNQEGGRYPNGAIVEITRSDGSVMRHKVNNTSARMEVGGSGGSSSGSIPGAAALGMISGSGSSNIERPNVSARFAQKEENFTYKSPVSVLETIRSVTNIVSGATKSFNRLSLSMDDSMDSTIFNPFDSKTKEGSNTELTSTPAFATKE